MKSSFSKTSPCFYLLNEIFEAAFILQVIKMYAWEKPFQLVVSAARAFEMSALRKSIFIRSVILGFMLFTERAILFFTMLTLVLSGQMVAATTVQYNSYMYLQ